MTDQEQDRKAVIEKLIQEGEELYQAGIDEDNENKLYMAQDRFEDVFAIEPSNNYAREKIEEIKFMRISIHNRQDKQCDKLLHAADKRFEEEDYDKAEDYYQRIIMACPNFRPYASEQISKIEALKRK